MSQQTGPTENDINPSPIPRRLLPPEWIQRRWPELARLEDNAVYLLRRYRRRGKFFPFKSDHRESGGVQWGWIIIPVLCALVFLPSVIPGSIRSMLSAWFWPIFWIIFLIQRFFRSKRITQNQEFQKVFYGYTPQHLYDLYITGVNSRDFVFAWVGERCSRRFIRNVGLLGILLSGAYAVWCRHTFKLNEIQIVVLLLPLAVIVALLIRRIEVFSLIAVHRSLYLAAVPRHVPRRLVREYYHYRVRSFIIMTVAVIIVMPFTIMFIIWTASSMGAMGALMAVNLILLLGTIILVPKSIKRAHKAPGEAALLYEAALSAAVTGEVPESILGKFESKDESENHPVSPAA